MRESDIEDYLVAKVKSLGGEIRKVKWVGRNKAPDRLVLLPTHDANMRMTFNEASTWVELKNPETIKTFPSNAHERAQHREHQRMRALGQTVLVLGTKEQIDGAFR